MDTTQPVPAQPAELSERDKHRLRQSLRAPTKLVQPNKATYVHDTPVTNRKERRKAELDARRYGCGNGKHSSKCPKYRPPQDLPKAAEPAAAKPGEAA